ncbi:MAG TPA: hypothetical protein VF736_19185 [Pyrinomonadaceae bacterium]|jgi:hypothetical protein
MPEIVEGIYRDLLRDAAGRPVYDSGWRSNMIVLSCRVLLAAFMRGDGAESPLGIQSLKLGRGDSGWDAAPPPKPDPDAVTQLVDATPYVIPKASLTLQYLNANNDYSNVPTNRLEIVASVGPGEPAPETGLPSPYPLREFGLFGRLKGADYMIDYVRHPLIEKDSAVTLERRVQLIF